MATKPRFRSSEAWTLVKKPRALPVVLHFVKRWINLVFHLDF
jgi:hypothetical protein